MLFEVFGNFAYKLRSQIYNASLKKNLTEEEKFFMQFLIQQLSDFLFLGLALLKGENLRELLFLWLLPVDIRH